MCVKASGHLCQSFQSTARKLEEESRGFLAHSFTVYCVCVCVCVHTLARLVSNFRVCLCVTTISGV